MKLKASPLKSTPVLTMLFLAALVFGISIGCGRDLAYKEHGNQATPLSTKTTLNKAPTLTSHFPGGKGFFQNCVNTKHLLKKIQLFSKNHYLPYTLNNP